MQRGVLPADFRTSMCSTALASLRCPLSSSCMHAHSLKELRAAAAVQLKMLPADYKMFICSSFNDTGEHQGSAGSGADIHSQSLTYTHTCKPLLLLNSISMVCYDPGFLLITDFEVEGGSRVCYS